MFVENKILPPDSRVWIFQSDRFFTADEEKEISNLAGSFISSWTAHNKELRGGFEIRNKLFLIIYLDENHTMASGCSIDKSVHFIRQIENKFSVSLLDRNVFAFKKDAEIKTVSRKDFEKFYADGTITSQTPVFNNLVNKKSELDTLWEVPLKDSWMQQMVS